MWPKQNFESGFGDWRNQRSSGVGWGGGRSVGSSGQWKSWTAGSRSTQSSNQKKAKTKPTSKKPTKRTLSKTETKTKTVANKRQKVMVKYSQIPLTKVMLVNPGSKDGGLPELVFGGFYDCAREAKLGKPRHLLQVEVTKKSEKKKGENNIQADWRVSIPVPTTSVEAVSIISGSNPFEKVLKAHSDRISLNNSIEHWNKVIRGRTVALQKKEEELQNLQKIEEEMEEASQAKADAEEKPEEDAVKGADKDKNTESRPTKSESPTKSNSSEPEVGEKKPDVTKDEKTKLSKEEEKKAQKERETRIRKKKFVISVIKKLTAAIEKAKKSLAIEQTKLDKISDEMGDELAYFQKDITDDEALSYFKQQLEEGIQSTDEQDSNGDKEDAAENDQEDVEMDADTENVEKSKEDVEMDADTETLEKSKEAEDESGDEEMVEAKDKALAETEKSESQENDSVEEVKKVESPKKSEMSKITEIPVWLVVSLKKPLDKAIISKNAPLSVKDHLKKASMIIMKFHPKHKKTIVLKGVTLQGSEEYMKILNQVLEGPWKAIRKDPNVFMEGNSPYSLMRNLKYLVMCQTRREVLDNIIENCQLCEKPFKHSAMEQHLKEFCPLREEECKFCSAVFAVCAMEEHHESECTKFPISCPDKCSKKFPRSEGEEHKKVCLNVSVDCEFKSFGCSKQIKRKELSRHLKITVFEHLELVKGRVTVLTDYMMKNDPAFKDFIMPTCEEPDLNNGETFV